MRIEYVLVPVLGAAFLLATVSPLIPSGAYSQWHDALYIAAAAWILATVLYRIAKREPVWRINLLGAVIILAVLTVYLTYVKIYAKPASIQIEKDLEVLEEARQTFEKYFAQMAAHTAVATSVVVTVAFVLAPFTLGISVAVVLTLVDLAIDVVNEFMSMIASYFGFAYAAVSLLAPLVRAVEIFTAVFVPVAATSVPSKKTIAITAYLAAVPLLLAAAIATAPGLAPMPGLLPTVEKDGFTQSVAVQINTNAPVVVEFKAPYVYYNGTHWANSSQWWWYTVLPPGANVTLTNGTWTLTRYIYMWVEYPVGITFTLQNGTFAWGAVNFTSVNATYFYPLPNRTFVIYVPYKWHDGWSVAASLKPNSTGVSGTKMNATWVFKYECYGTVGQCPGTRWELEGLAAEYRDLTAKVLGAEYADVSYSKSAVAAAMGEDGWERICNATESAVLSAFGASCSGWHPTKQWSASIDVSSQPQIECRTVGNETRCEEVETWHRATVAVSLLYVPAPTPAAAGFQRGELSTKDVVDTIYGYAFYALSSIFPLGAGFASLAEKFVAPFVWIWTSLIPWALRLIYTIAAVMAGTAGVLIIVGAGAPMLRILGISQFFQLKLHAKSIESTALQLASRGFAAAGRGGAAAAGSAGASVAAGVAQNVAATWGPRMWALYVSSALKWTAWLWRFDPIRLAAAMWLSAYVGSKLFMNVVIKAPHPLLQPAADALSKLVDFAGRQLKGAHLLVHHGSPLTPEGLAAKYSAEALDWVWAATHLRIDWMIAKLIAYLLHGAYRLSGGDMNLAVQWTVIMLLSGKPKPPRHAGDLAAFAVLFDIKTKPFPVNPEDLAAGFKLFGYSYTQEQAVALYLAHLGYDYARLRQAWETYKDWFTQRTDISRPELFTYLPSHPHLRNAMADFAVKRWKEGDHSALLFSPIPEFRKLAREQLGVEVTPEGNTMPIWNMWLKGGAKAAERGDIEAALKLGPGPMGKKVEFGEPLELNAESFNKLKGTMEHIVSKAARAAGVDRDAAAAGVWKMLEDPQMRRMLKLEGDYKRLEDALRQAASDILPKDVIEKGLPGIMQGEALKAIYELVKGDKPQWFERLPEHVQEKIISALPYGDWSYVYSAKYAAEVADITWREITPMGEVVEHRVLDYLPASVREAVVAQRLTALDAPPPQQQASPPSPAAVDYSKYAEAMQMFSVKSYEAVEGGQAVERQIKPEDLAAFGTPTEVRKMLAEVAMFVNASEKHYDEGKDYMPLEVKWKDEEEKEKKLREFLESQLQEIRNAALAAGLNETEAEAAAEQWLKMLTSSEYADFRDKLLDFALYEDGPDAYMALLNMIEAAGRYAAAKEPEAAERLEEAPQPAQERYTPAGERYAPAEDRYEPVGEERVEAEVGKIKDEDHAEAVRRILGIDVTKAEDESVAYEISRSYGLPHDVATKLAEDFGEYAKEVAKEVKRVDDWLAKAGADDEFRRRYIEQNLGRIVEDADGVIRGLAEEAAKKAPKELQDLVADDLAKGKFDEVNWKLSQIQRYCESKGGCTPEEKRGFYTKL